jgi:hypothetical protein
MTVSETVVGMKVAKQFELGLFFVIEITAVTGKRGRCLYTVLYEDGDGEDMMMNNKEFKDARALFQKKKGKIAHIAQTLLDLDETEGDTLHSGGKRCGSTPF